VRHGELSSSIVHRAVVIKQRSGKISCRIFELREKLTFTS
jgi:hypothetical protein